MVWEALLPVTTLFAGIVIGCWLGKEIHALVSKVVDTLLGQK